MKRPPPLAQNRCGCRRRRWRRSTPQTRRRAPPAHSARVRRCAAMPYRAARRAHGGCRVSAAAHPTPRGGGARRVPALAASAVSYAHAWDARGRPSVGRLRACFGLWARSCPHLHQDWAHPFHICTGTRLIPATSAPGPGSPPPHLRRDWAHRCHTCSGTKLIPSHICTGTGLAPPTSAPRLRSPLPISG